MVENETSDRTPLALVVEGNDALASSLVDLLGGHGFAVLRAAGGRQALELLGKVRPDLLLIGLILPDATGPDVVRALARVPTVRSSTPIVMVSERALDPASRVESFESGAWEVLEAPFEGGQLVPQLRAFVAAKMDADSAREEGLLDPTTGFYNIRGVLRRVGEVAADAARYQRPVACVVVGPDRSEGDPLDRRSAERLSEEMAVGITATTRLSDTLGRLGDADFVVVAAGTDQEGANRLAERLLARLDPSTEALFARPLRLRAGVYAIPGHAGTSVIPVDLLTRATLALRRAQDEGNGQRIFGYERA
ncbi:MAG: response regulator [Gemmatimonadota bacterium]